MLKGFWARVVGVGLRARVGFRIAAVVSCYGVAYAPGIPLRVAALFAAMVFGYVMFLSDYGVFTRPLLLRWRLRGKVSWAEPPDFLVRLANEMGVKLNKKRPFGVTVVPVGAVANMSTRRLVVSRDVLALPPAERDSVLAHELAHLRPNQARLLLLALYAAMLVPATIGNVPQIIQIIGTTGLLLLVLTFVSWRLEYDADKVASKYTSGEALASALGRLVKPGRHDEASDTHPSVNSRVARLLTPSEPFWTRLFLSLARPLVPRSFHEEFLRSFLRELNEYCQGRPRVARPFVAVVQFLKVLLFLRRRRDH